MKTMKITCALIVCLLAMASLSSDAAYQMGNTSETTQIGGAWYSWTGSYQVGPAIVSGTVSCPTAHDVAATLHVYYHIIGMTNVLYVSVGNTADPGTYASRTWNAGTAYGVNDNSSVFLEVNGYLVQRVN